MARKGSQHKRLRDSKFKEPISPYCVDACFQCESDLFFPLDTYGSCVIQIGTNIHYMENYLNRSSELCSNMFPLIKTCV